MLNTGIDGGPYLRCRPARLKYRVARERDLSALALYFVPRFNTTVSLCNFFDTLYVMALAFTYDGPRIYMMALAKIRGSLSVAAY